MQGASNYVRRRIQAENSLCSISRMSVLADVERSLHRRYPLFAITSPLPTSSAFMSDRSRLAAGDNALESGRRELNSFIFLFLDSPFSSVESMHR